MKFLRYAFGRITRTVLWCFGVRPWDALPHTCDVCGKSSRKVRTQPVPLPNWTLLVCPACAERGELEMARKVQEEVGLRHLVGKVLERNYVREMAVIGAMPTLHGAGTKERG